MILIFLFVSSTSVMVVQATNSDDVYLNELSDFYLVDQKMTSNDGSKLVPEGVVRGVNDVYHVDFEYEVVVKKGMDLQVLVEDLLFTNELVTEEELQETFYFTVNQKVVEELEASDQFFGGNEEAERVVVTISVAMNQPQSYESFQHLIGGQLTFEVYFFAAVLPE